MSFLTTSKGTFKVKLGSYNVYACNTSGFLNRGGTLLAKINNSYYQGNAHSWVSTFHGVNVAASIQTYAISIPDKRPCGPKSTSKGI